MMEEWKGAGGGCWRRFEVDSLCYILLRKGGGPKQKTHNIEYGTVPYKNERKLCPVGRIQDVYHGSRITYFYIPDPGSKRQQIKMPTKIFGPISDKAKIIKTTQLFLLNR
jgi:hypothetical protein